MRNKKRLLFILCLPVMQLFPSLGKAQGIEITNLTTPGTITCIGAATIEINDGSLINNGTYTKGTETVTFSGTTAKTISGSSSAELYNLSVTNTGGITTQLGQLTTNNLTISSGSKFTIEAGKLVEINGSLTNSAGNDGLVIKSTSDAANGTGSLINSTTGVSATVERWMSGDLWHLISPTATGSETIADFVGATQNSNLITRNTINYGLAPYIVSTDSWDYYKVANSNSGTFSTPAKGYQVLRATGSGTGNGNVTYNGKVSFKGTLAAGAQSIAVDKTGNRWNLLGNPFPCALNIATFLSTNSALIDPSYLFIYVSKMSDITTYGYEPNESELKLSSGEGFFIKAKTGETSAINFSTAMKSTSSDAFKSAKIDYTGIKLFAESKTNKMSTSVKYLEGMTNGLDPGWDAGLFNGGHSTFSLFTRLVQDNGVDFAIQCLPYKNLENLIVPVGLIAEKGSTVNFKASVINFPTDYKVYLEDRSTNTFIRLDETGSFYSVVLKTDCMGTGRFYLHTSQIEPTNKMNPTLDLKIIALPKQHIIRVLGAVNLPAKAIVYDITGRIITTKQLTGPEENEIPLINSKSGVYLLKIESNMNQHAEKISWIIN